MNLLQNLKMKSNQNKTTGCDLSIRGEAKQNSKQPQMFKVCYHDFLSLELKTCTYLTGTNYYARHRAVGWSENLGVPVLFNEHDILP